MGTESLSGMEPRPDMPAPPPDPAPWGLRGALGVTVLAYAAQLVLGLLLGGFAWAVLAFLDPDLVGETQEMAEAVILVTVVPLALLSSIVTLGLVYGSVVLMSRRPLLESLCLRRPTFHGLASFTMLGAVLALLFLVGSIFFPPSEQEELGGPLSRLAESGPFGYGIWMALAILMAPFVEEVLFRGYAYLGARQRLGPVWAGAWVTLIFTALHVTETGTYWPALAGILLLSTILVLVMERTGNLFYCIFCHLGYNGALASLSLLGTE